MSKRILFAGLAGLISITIAGCGGATSEASVASDMARPKEQTEVAEQGKTKTVSCNGLNIEVNASWDVRDDGGMKTVSTDFGGELSVAWQKLAADATDAEKVYSAFAEGITISGVALGSGPEKFAIGEAIAYRVDGDYVSDGVTYKGSYELILPDDKSYYSIMFTVPEDSYANSKGEVKSVLDSITLD